MTKARDAWFLAALAAITAIGIVLRFYQLDELPTGLFSDEAMNGLDAIDTMNQTGIRLWIPDNFDRGLVAEGLMSHLQALMFSWFGVSITALRAPSALAGALLVPFVGLLARELFRSPVGGLAAAFLAATSSWAVLLSRQAYPAPLVPLCAASGTYFAIRGMRRGQRWALVLAGVIFGLGIYSYAAYRVMPLYAAAGVLLALWVFSPSRVARALAWTGGAALLTAAPMLWAFRAEPGLLTARSSALSIAGEGSDPLSVAATVGRNSLLAIGKYHVSGDTNWRYNLSGEPLLDPVTGFLFLVGLVAAVVAIILGSRSPRESIPRRLGAGAALVLAGLLIAQLPEILANEGNPHALRSIGSQAFVFPLAGLAVASVLRWTRSWRSTARRVVGAILAFGLVAAAALNVHALFWTYRQSLGHHYNSQTNVRAVAEYLDASDSQEDVAVIGLYLYDRAVIEFLAPEASPVYVGAPEETREASTVIIATGEPGIEQAVIQGRWLQRREVIDTRPGTGSQLVVLTFGTGS